MNFIFQVSVIVACLSHTVSLALNARKIYRQGKKARARRAV